jgi:hypothetical protein
MAPNPRLQSETRPWQPMRRGPINPHLQRVRQQVGAQAADEVWGNDLYQVVVNNFESGVTHLSIKTHDRSHIRDWRHFQAMKNEICGPEREAIEIYPAESRLVDSSNEYHLWVLPEGAQLPVGFPEPLVSSDKQVEMFNAGRERGEHKGRQRPFQPGLPVGVGRNEQPGADRDLMADYDIPQSVMTGAEEEVA